MINFLKKAILMYGVKPVSRKFGFDRGYLYHPGKPIDRYYIEKFLFKNRKYIRGKTLEISGSTYTKKFGGKKVKESHVLSYVPGKDVDIVGDLVTGRGLPLDYFDCFIMTQTLPFIYDLKSAIKNSIALLKKGGTLLITVNGISQISRYDMNRWGHYWNFTNISLKHLLEEQVSKKNIRIETYGNVKVACSMLYGLSQEDLNQSDFYYNDEDYQLVITALVKKTLK
jgi:hypothetical protein